MTSANIVRRPFSLRSESGPKLLSDSPLWEAKVDLLTPPGIPVGLPSSSTPRRVTGIWWVIIPPYFSSATQCYSRYSFTRRREILPLICETGICSGTLSR
uniref:Uncharacterized protein n=1 Tax=Cacopsylla melanoneura TaxID=428564 RepID=A0A8D8UEI9_9HEMI